MNKEEIVKELNKYIKDVDGDFKVEIINGNLDLIVDRVNKPEMIFTFSRCDYKDFAIINSIFIPLLNQGIKSGVFTEFYKKGVELLKQLKEPQYTVSLSKDSTTNYLNIDKRTGGFFFSTNDDTDKVQAYFTKVEIENMKSDPRFKAINFDEAVIEEVEE